MKLTQLFAIYSEYKMGQTAESEINKITSDSRDVEAGDVFVAISGTTFDGHTHLAQVAEKGAIGLVVSDENHIPDNYSGAISVVSDTRFELARLAHRFYGQPSNEMFCVGVTGTNGKTSTCYMIEKILTDFGWKTGVLGTIDHHLGDRVWNSELTTPDPITLTQRLQQMQAVGANAIVMEVSSHALNQKRAHGLSFDVGVFTNLSRDHMDYHDSMEDYFGQKELLFTQLLANPYKGARAAVVNMDDSWGPQLRVAGGVKWLGYGKNAYHIQMNLESMDFSGTHFNVKYMNKDFEGFIPQVGDFSMYNAGAAIGAAMHAGVSMESCLKSLSEFNGVPGRMEKVNTSNGINCFVDYAHTDDALHSVLSVLQDIRRFSKESHKIHCVFGCGGDRDKGKRPLMMKAAMEGADKVYVTSDNPRTEDPQQIINEIVSKVPESQQADRVTIEVDRRKAIQQALLMASPGDVVLVAGKGHEDYQVIGTEKTEFSDQNVIMEYAN